MSETWEKKVKTHKRFSNITVYVARRTQAPSTGTTGSTKAWKSLIRKTKILKVDLLPSSKVDHWKSRIWSETLFLTIVLWDIGKAGRFGGLILKFTWNQPLGFMRGKSSPILRKTTTLNMDSRVGITTPKNTDSFFGCRCWADFCRELPGCCSTACPSVGGRSSASLTLVARR